jgi:hypothetical protein
MDFGSARRADRPLVLVQSHALSVFIDSEIPELCQEVLVKSTPGPSQARTQEIRISKSDGANASVGKGLTSKSLDYSTLTGRVEAPPDGAARLNMKAPLSYSSLTGRSA